MFNYIHRYVFELYYARITELNLSYKNLTVLPDLSLYVNLQTLHCHNNQLTSLDNLPPNLQKLNCSNNQLIFLENLPSNLQALHCHNNQLTSLDNLPPNLQELRCDHNQLTSPLDHLPTSLKRLFFDTEQLTFLDNLPSNLQILHCCINKTKIKTKFIRHPLSFNLQEEFDCVKQLTSYDCFFLKLLLYNEHSYYEMYEFTLSMEIIKMYNEIKRMEKECCPLLK